jgi:hypothetical protein
MPVLLTESQAADKPKKLLERVRDVIRSSITRCEQNEPIAIGLNALFDFIGCGIQAKWARQR